MLGDEQSGQIREVGYELYQSMLEDALSKMRSGELEGLSDFDDNWAPQINLGVPVLILKNMFQILIQDLACIVDYQV